MWQLFASLYLFLQGGQDLIDKTAIVRDKKIDSLAASFLRTALFVVMTGVVGLSGLFGPLQFFFSPLVVLNAVLGAGSAILWTYLLKHVEVTAIAALGYLSPLFFLFIDASLLDVSFDLPSTLGVLLLVGGGLFFVVDSRHMRLRKTFTKPVLSAALLGLLITTAEGYSFQHLHSQAGVNEVSFAVSTWGISTVLLLIFILWKGEIRGVLPAARHNHYFTKVSVSKGLDVFSSLFWLKAIAIAPVSTVTAFASLYPLLLLVLATMGQRFGVRLEEDVRRRALAVKLTGTLLLAAGAYLVS